MALLTDAIRVLAVPVMVYAFVLVVQDIRHMVKQLREARIERQVAWLKDRLDMPQRKWTREGLKRLYDALFVHPEPLQLEFEFWTEED